MSENDSFMGELAAFFKEIPSNLLSTMKFVLSPKFLREYKKELVILFLLCIYPIAPAIAGMDYLIHIAVIANLFAMIALSWDINGGYTGQGNLAAGFFAGICGYTSAILTTQAGWPILPSLLLGIFFSFISAVGIGFPSLRMKGPYLVIVTFAVAEVARKLTIYFSDVTQGEEGIGGIPRIVTGSFVNFYWTLAVLIIVFIVARKIIQSKWGLAFRAIAKDETRARTLGVNVTNYKILSFSLCGIFAGLAGGLFAHYQAHIDPHFFSIIMAISIISMAVIGGEKTLIGPILGAYILQFMTEGLRFVTGGAPWVRQGLHGLLLLVVMLFLPGGILSLIRGTDEADEDSGVNRFRSFIHGIFFIEEEEAQEQEA